MTPVTQSYRQVLRSRPLAILLAGDVLSKVGDGMLLVALPLLALRIYEGKQPALAIGLVTASPFIISVGISLYFGLGRHRYKPKTVLVSDASLRSAVVVAAALLSAAEVINIWGLAVALAAGSALRLIAASGRRLVATELAGGSGRFAVNGLLGTTDSLALYVVGPALGGLLSATFGAAVVVGISGASCLLLLLAVLVSVPRDAAYSEKVRKVDVSGLKILSSVPVAAVLFGVVFFFNLFYMPVEIALPLLVRGELGGTDATLGLVWTSFGVGAFVGALMTNFLRKVREEVLLIAIIMGWACCVGILAIAETPTMAVVALAAGGLIYAPFTPVAYSLIQSRLSVEQQQPVVTLWAAGTVLAAPLGLLIGGPLVAGVGVRQGLVVSVVLTMALVPLSAWGMSRKKVYVPNDPRPH